MRVDECGSEVAAPLGERGKPLLERHFETLGEAAATLSADSEVIVRACNAVGSARDYLCGDRPTHAFFPPSRPGGHHGDGPGDTARLVHNGSLSPLGVIARGRELGLRTRPGS